MRGENKVAIEDEGGTMALIRSMLTPESRKIFDADVAALDAEEAAEQNQSA